MSLRTLIRQVGSFGAIGTAALLVDAALLYAAQGLLGLGFYPGRALSWLGAATFTWYLNRRFTFRNDPAQHPSAQWLRFLLANLPGGAINYAVSTGVKLVLPQDLPLGAVSLLTVAAGSLAGLVANFSLSKRYVFKD